MKFSKALTSFVLRYGILAWLAAGVVWYVIVSTLADGISCDEGYYLMGYLRGQNIDGQGSDFHSIVRALCCAFSDEDIMVFRYMRLALNSLAIIVFALSSYWWLSKKKGLAISRWAYYPMVALAGAMSFTFAAPTISYDSLEVIIALLAASMLFVQLSGDRGWVKNLAAIGLGFFLWFGITNYPPAGMCLLVLFAILFFMEYGQGKWWGLVSATVGFILAILIQHLCVHDLHSWFPEVEKMFVSFFTETSHSHHDSSSLFSGMLLTVGKQALVLIPIAALSFLFYRKVRLPEWLNWGLVVALCLFLLVYRHVYELRGTLMLIPVALMLGKVLASTTLTKGGKRFQFSIVNFQFLITLLIFVAIPFAGVFGTNQAIMRKSIMFTPFWLLAYYILSTRLKETHRLNLIFLTLLFAGYVYLGNFQRYQYYYTPRSSKHELVGASRPQSVKVSKYQQEYYRDLLDSLRLAGCQPGDRYIAFEEDLMAVYLAGGYIEGRLPYHWWQYTEISQEAPTAFILFKSEEEDVLHHFESVGWQFPESYRRMEMRQAAENMGDNLRTVIYVRKQD